MRGLLAQSVGRAQIHVPLGDEWIARIGARSSEV